MVGSVGKAEEEVPRILSTWNDTDRKVLTADIFWYYSNGWRGEYRSAAQALCWARLLLHTAVLARPAILET